MILVLNNDTICCRPCWADIQEFGGHARPDYLIMASIPEGVCLYCGSRGSDLDNDANPV